MSEDIDIQVDISLLRTWYNLAGSSSISGAAEKHPSDPGAESAVTDTEWLDISEGIRSRIREIETTSKNTEDSLSFVKTVSAALDEMHEMLTRMAELATQASKDVHDSAIDRKALDREFQQLKREVDRIAGSIDSDLKHLLSPQG